MLKKESHLLPFLASPGIWEMVLGCYAVLALLYIYLGMQEWIGEQSMGVILAVLGISAVIPYLFVIWGRRRPPRNILTDVRIWLLTLIAAAGFGLSIAICTRENLLDTLTLLLFIPLVIAACLWAYLRYRRGHGAALAKAQKTGWRLSESELAALGVEESLLQEMTPRQRLFHHIVLYSGFLVFFSAATLFLVKKTPPLESYTALWVIFISDVSLLTWYYSRLLRREYVQKKRTALELSVARQMQMALLPERDPEVAGFDIAGACFPAEEVGGDLYAYFASASGDKTFGIALADVSGKAMKAAIATVLVSGILRAESRRSGEPAEILARTNSALLGGMDPYMFVAMQVLILDPATGRVTYSNAGQVHPLLLRRGQFSLVELNALPLGLVEGCEYETLALNLEPGDALFFVSDGITEAMNGRREMYGSERLEKAILALDPSRPARRLIEDLVAGVEAFCGKILPSDDRTVVVVKRI